MFERNAHIYITNFSSWLHRTFHFLLFLEFLLSLDILNIVKLEVKIRNRKFNKKSEKPVIFLKIAWSYGLSVVALCPGYRLVDDMFNLLVQSIAEITGTIHFRCSLTFDSTTLAILSPHYFINCS